jgi:hypothetical protein
LVELVEAVKVSRTESAQITYTKNFTSAFETGIIARTSRA